MTIHYILILMLSCGLLVCTSILMLLFIRIRQLSSEVRAYKSRTYISDDEFIALESSINPFIKGTIEI